MPIKIIHTDNKELAEQTIEQLYQELVDILIERDEREWSNNKEEKEK